jgi:iron complex outermembrane receptor protein
MNIGLSQFGGVECQVKGDFSKMDRFQSEIFSLTQWGIKSNFLTTSMSNNEYVSKYVYNQINQQNIVFLGMQTGKHITHQLTYRSWQRSNQPMVHLLDWRTSFQLDEWSIFADLSNLTNQKYSFTGDVIMPGTWYQIGVQYTLPGK